MRVVTICVTAAVAMVLAVAGTGKAASVSIGDVEGHVGVADVSVEPASFREEFTAHGPGADTHEVSVIAGTGGPLESSLSYALDDSPAGLLGDFQVETTISVDEGTHSAGSAMAAQFTLAQSTPFILHVTGFAANYSVRLNGDRMAWTFRSGDPRYGMTIGGNIPVEGLEVRGVLDAGDHLFDFNMRESSFGQSGSFANGTARLMLVPEPTSAALLGAAAIGFVRRRRRRRCTG